MGKPKDTYNPYRQVMQLGQAAGLVVSLPNAWCRKYGIKKGQIVKLEEVLDVTQERTGLFLRVVRMPDVGECQMPGEVAANQATCRPGGKGKEGIEQ